MRGKTIGRYRVVEKLDEGGMGTVYLAEHTLIGRRAAIKTLRPELSHNQGIVRRFFNEAKATTVVKHPGIVEIYDFGFHDDDIAFIVMEYLEGETLKGRLKRTPRLNLTEIIDFIRQTASALAVVHKNGIIHRDLKPDNIFLIPDPEIGTRVKLLDFGIAKLLEDQDDLAQKTRTGTIMGTPFYMSPEQCRGAGEVDARTDFYALGCIMFEMLCGRPPFVMQGSGAVIGAHLYEQPPPLRSLELTVPQALETFVLQLLAKEPADRFADASELLHALPGNRPPTSDGVLSRFELNAVAPVEVPRAKSDEQTTLSAASTSMNLVDVDGATKIVRQGRLWGWSIGASVMTAVLLILGFVLFTQSRGDDTADELASSEQTGEHGGDVLKAAIIDAGASTTLDRKRTGRLLQTDARSVQQLSIEFESTPSGAAVYRRGSRRKLGETNFSYAVSPSGERQFFEIQKRGYRTEKVDFIPNEARIVTVTLKKRGQTYRRRKDSAGKPEKNEPQSNDLTEEDLEDGALVISDDSQ